MQDIVLSILLMCHQFGPHIQANCIDNRNCQHITGNFKQRRFQNDKNYRACIGIIGIAVGVFVKAFISDTSSSFTWLIFLFLIIQSIGFIATGITQSNKSKAIRIPKIIIGAGIMVALIGTFFEFHDLPIKLLTILLSINILIIGIEVITSAISRKIVQSSSS